MKILETTSEALVNNVCHFCQFRRNTGLKDADITLSGRDDEPVNNMVLIVTTCAYEYMENSSIRVKLNSECDPDSK